ncbi:MAG: hypothetical protein JNM29_05395 [Candidatus Odyssella sp.]|nr:hypothetical protein [Candidatus Odyssella sp.]
MAIASPAPLNFVRAFPHVGGQSRRVKAAPTALTQTAAAMMGASGVICTKTRAPSFPARRFAAAALLVLSAATLAIAGDQRWSGDSARGAHMLLAHSDAFASLGVGEYGAALSELAPAAAPAPAAPLDGQDRFEVERLFRLSGAR